MSAPKNQAAWLEEAGTPLKVGPAAMPTAAAGEIVIKNSAVAINPVDWHQQDTGVFVQQFPAVLGCDVAGEVNEVGSSVEGFKKGDRVIGRPADGAYALYTIVPADKAAVLPNHISFADGVVLPFAIEAATCALSAKEPGPCMPGVLTPALGLPYPTLGLAPSAAGKLLVVNGASSSTGSMAIQLATAAGIEVIAISSAKNYNLVKECGANHVFDRNDSSIVDKVIEAAQGTGLEFAGIFDAISTAETYAQDIEILRRLDDSSHLACTHPPPTENVPASLQTGMIFAVSDLVTPIFRDFVTPALQAGQLKCLPPPTVIGKGLEHINTALKMLKEGISATKLVVEL